MEGLKSDAWDIAFIGIDPSRSAEADFTPAYMEVDLTYLVPGSSDVERIPDADKPGVRIAVPRNDLVDIVLGRMLKHAQLVRADTVAGAFDLLRTGQADVCAEPRPNLVEDQEHLPGSRVLSDRFGVNRLGIVVPKGKSGHLSFLTEFVEAAKASGLVQRAIDHAGLRGVQVAPPGDVIGFRAVIECEPAFGAGAVGSVVRAAYDAKAVWVPRNLTAA